MIFVRKMYSELLRQLFLVFLVLILIISISQMIRFLKMLSAGRITISALFKLLALVVPSALGYLIPPCMLLAIILVLCRYYLDNEMAVLVSSGVSHLRIYKIIMLFALGVAIVVSVITFIISPYTEVIRKSGFEYAVKQVSLEKIESKQFVNLGVDSLIYAKDQSADRSSLQHVHIFRKRQAGIDNNWNVLYANNMNQFLVHLKDDKRTFIVFNDGFLDVVANENGGWQHTTFSKMFYLLPGFSYTADVWPRDLNLFELLKAAKVSNNAAGLLARKLALVLSVFVLAFIGCMLGYAKPRQGKVTQFLPALIFYGIYVYAITFVQQKIESGDWSLLGSMCWMHSILLLICILFASIRYRQTIISKFNRRRNA